MTARTDLLKSRLEKSRAYVNRVLDQVGDGWETQIYEDGPGWTARQIVVHIGETERGITRTIRTIVAGENPVPPDFDIDRYNARMTEKTADVSPEQARANMAETHAALLAWLDTLSDDDLDKEGRHPTLNVFPVETFVKILSAHQRDHTADIARKLNITA
jgi:hypothetical protein